MDTEPPEPLSAAELSAPDRVSAARYAELSETDQHRVGAALQRHNEPIIAAWGMESQLRRGVRLRLNLGRRVRRGRGGGRRPGARRRAASRSAGGGGDPDPPEPGEDAGRAVEDDVGPARFARSVGEFHALRGAVQRRAWRELAHAIDRKREAA